MVYNSSSDKGVVETIADLYDRKISGSSNNLGTFAAELKRTIQEYEKRLSDVKVSMTYRREERKIYIDIKGVITESGTAYSYSSVINVWK